MVQAQNAKQEHSMLFYNTPRNAPEFQLLPPNPSHGLFYYEKVLPAFIQSHNPTLVQGLLFKYWEKRDQKNSCYII